MPARPHRAELREKGSRFVATALPVRGLKETRAALESLRAEFPDATHHCWAARVPDGRGGWEERRHDAGEPDGTAGAPILQAIRKTGHGNILVVVTRWFGGTKLGKGGLARAYRAAAAQVLAALPAVRTEPTCRLLVRVPLPLDGETRNLVARHGGRIESSACTADESALTIALPPAARRGLEDALGALTRGRGRIDDAGPI